VVDVVDIIDVLERAGHRRTAPRRALAEVIAQREGHFTAESLLDESRRRHLGIDRATIFRSLELLAELGVVERLDLPSGEHAFVACEARHHHHVVCSSCGRSTGVADHGLDRIAVAIGEAIGYRIDTHRLELFGTCPACQAGATQ
jgi:Fe2+ or Zn2+ uptake regulation protein